MTRPRDDTEPCLDDAAYLLGALVPEERAAFEAHLRLCPRCPASLTELSGLPGLLARVPPEVATALEDLDDPAVPPTADLLADVLDRTRRYERRRRWRRAAATGTVAASLVLVAAVATDTLRRDAWLDGPDRAGETVVLDPLDEVPVSVTVHLEPVQWGTRVELVCTYEAREPGTPDARWPPDYSLVLQDDDGEVEHVGSWRAVPGGQTVIDAPTSLAPADIRRVEVRTSQGVVLLRAEV